MAEEYPKSRLKRKKLSTDKCRTEILAYSKSSESCEATKGSSIHTHEWWNRDDLCAEENLWAFTLKSTLASLEAKSWGPVPEFPVTSVTSIKPSDWRWCSLSEEVPSFPGPSPPPTPPMVNPSPTMSPSKVIPAPPPGSTSLSPFPEGTAASPEQTRQTPSIPGPVKPKPCQHDVPGAGTISTHGLTRGHTTGDHGSKDRVPETTLKKVRRDKRDAVEKMRPPTPQHNSVCAPSTSLRGSHRPHHPSIQGWVRGSLPGSRSGGEKVEGEKERGSPIKRHLPAHRGEASDSCAASEGEGEEEEEEGVSGSCGLDPGRSTGGGGDEGGEGDGDGDGGGGLQSCPMCLVAFPAGFTQMDCDSHLAQCLSEMNVDMTW